ncbi:MAG: hypothetical protein ACRDFX_08110 [Chloroflexota bacterium]
MNAKHSLVGGACLCIAAVLAGCGQAAGAPPIKSSPKPHSTPVPAALVGYSSAAVTTLQMTLHEAGSLVSGVHHTDSGTLANECSLAGADFANQYSAFQSVYVPVDARTVRSNATVGYKDILGAIDECGMAGDMGSKSQLKVALKDMNSGLGYISRAEAALHSWSGRPS